MKTTMIATTLSLLLTTTIPAEAPDHTQPQYIWGTTSLSIDDFLILDYNICNRNALKATCGDTLAERGRTYFDTTSWNNDVGTKQGREVTIWVNLIHGIIPPDVGGFAVLVCSDLNDNQICNESGGDSDLLAWGYSNDGIQESDLCNKDKKDCGDPYAAQVQTCIPLDDDGEFDDLGVFLVLWASDGLFFDAGAGLSEGIYGAYLTPGDFVASC